MLSHPTSLRFAVLLAVLVAVIPVVALNLYHAEGSRRQQQQEHRDDAVRLAEQAAAGVSRYLEGTRQLLVAIAYTAPIRDRRTAEASALLADLRTTSPLLGNIMLVDNDGTPLASAIPLQTTISVADRPYFRRLQVNRTIGLGEHQIGRVTGRPSLNMACALPGQPKTGPLACVVAALDMPVLQQLLDDFPRPPDTDLVLLDRNGVIIAQRGATFAPNGRRFPEWVGLPHNLQLDADDAAGNARTVQFTLVPSADEGLWVGVGVRRSFISDDARRAFLHSLAIASLLALPTLLVALWITHHLVLRPIRRLTQAAAALAGGEWSARAGLDSNVAELRSLGETFDAMASHLHGEMEQLRANQQGSPPPNGSAALASTRQQLESAIAAQHAADAALRRSEATSRAFIDSIPETAMLVDPDGTVLVANQTAANRLGCELAQLVGCNIFDRMDPPLAAERRGHLATVKSTRHPLDFDTILPGRSLHNQLTPVLDSAGEVAAIAVLSFDITERRSMEEQLRRSVAELKQALSEVHKLSGLLPICAGCKRIRDDQGYWNDVEQYLGSHTGAVFSHGLCPDCVRRLYPEYADAALAALHAAAHGSNSHPPVGS